MSDRTDAELTQITLASLFSGIVLIAAGLGIWFHPGLFVPFVGAVMIVEGARLAWDGLVVDHGDGLDGARLVVGILAMVLGGAIWLYPDKTAPIVLYAVGGWSVVFGLFIAILGLTGIGSGSGSWLDVIVGALLGASGFAIWSVPTEGAVTLVTVFGALVIVSGIVRMLDATPLQAGGHP